MNSKQLITLLTYLRKPLLPGLVVGGCTSEIVFRAKDYNPQQISINDVQKGTNRSLPTFLNTELYQKFKKTMYATLVNGISSLFWLSSDQFSNPSVFVEDDFIGKRAKSNLERLHERLQHLLSKGAFNCCVGVLDDRYQEAISLRTKKENAQASHPLFAQNFKKLHKCLASVKKLYYTGREYLFSSNAQHILKYGIAMNEIYTSLVFLSSMYNKLRQVIEYDDATQQLQYLLNVLRSRMKQYNMESRAFPGLPTNAQADNLSADHLPWIDDAPIASQRPIPSTSSSSMHQEPSDQDHVYDMPPCAQQKTKTDEEIDMQSIHKTIEEYYGQLEDLILILDKVPAFLEKDPAERIGYASYFNTSRLQFHCANISDEINAIRKEMMDLKNKQN